MNRKERISQALKRFDYLELARITMEKDMKIDVKQVDTAEELEKHGNRFFTHKQIEEIRSA